MLLFVTKTDKYSSRECESDIVNNKKNNDSDNNDAECVWSISSSDV